MDKPNVRLLEVPPELMAAFNRASEGYDVPQVVAAGLAIAALGWGYLGHDVRDLASSAGMLGHIVEEGARVRERKRAAKQDAEAEAKRRPEGK